jgi:hypothetical protein
MNGEGAIPEGGYFQYWMRSPGGDVIWAKLAPEFWKEILKDGDQLKLSFPSVEPFVTFLYHAGKDEIKRAVVPVPKSYEVVHFFSSEIVNIESHPMFTRKQYKSLLRASTHMG